ncbi:MAG TPA: flagellar hook-basal body complex protein FliE [Terriglobia bacterium]|jgi:flagellar hook-basal body complex protein FliE|nr:flagellar hook-basal body complex protein FliE [Terriglobia bacterium]
MSNSIQGLPPIDPSQYQQNVSKTAPGKNSEFLDTLQKTLDQAQQMQAEADQKVTSLLNGQNTGDVQSVLLALEKADLSFQLVMQARNKIVQAYNTISNMQF